MKEKEGETINALQIQLDDLATGQLGPLTAWRLRRRIARDPTLAREFAEIQQMQADLRSLARQSGSQPAQSPAMTWTIGGLTMKRRAVLAATAALTFVTITGAVAARHYLTFTPQNYLVDTKDHQWLIRTRLPGVVRILDPEGNIVGRMVFEGGFPASNALEVQYGNYRQGLSALYLSKTFEGPGRHALRNRSGVLLGYVEVLPLTAEDKGMIGREQNLHNEWLTAFYTRPGVFTEESGFNGDQKQMGVSVGITYPGVMSRYSRDTGLAWKVVGYAVVSGWERPAFPGAMSHWKSEGVYADSVDSLPPSPPILRKQAKQIQSLASPRHAPPRLYWQIADKNDLIFPLEGSPTAYHAIEDGHWRTVARSGVFTGYGRHEIKDEKGNLLLALRLSPLTPTKAAR